MMSIRLLLVLAFSFDVAESNNPIEQTEIEAAQKEWAAAIVNMGAKLKEGQTRDYVKALADSFVDGFYAFSIAPTLLKPSTTQNANAGDVNASFCTTRDCAISHFIGPNAEEPGLALKSWSSLRFENIGVLLQGDVAMAMGNCFFTDASGAETRIENSFAYIRDSSGKLRISLHHASVPATAGAINSQAPAAVAEASTTTTTTAVADTATVAAAETVTVAVAETATVAAAEAATVAAAETATVAAAETTTTTTLAAAETTTVAVATETTQAPETTTTTVALADMTTTKDWFFEAHKGGSNHHAHNKFHGMGLAAKRKDFQDDGGSTLGMLMKLVVLVLIAVSLVLTYFVSQVKGNMSAPDKVLGGLALLQRKVGLTKKNSDLLGNGSVGSGGYSGYNGGFGNDKDV